MLRRFAVAAAALAAVAAAALAFEFTSWGGTLECDVKAKVFRGEKFDVEADYAGTGLSTQETTWDFSNLGPGTISGRMSRRNDRNYRTFHFDEGPQYDSFLAWVRDKVMLATGLDVTVAEASLKGKFVLNGEFDAVKVLDKIKFVGVVASGPDAGKPVKGSIRIKGVLARN